MRSIIHVLLRLHLNGHLIAQSRRINMRYGLLFYGFRNKHSRLQNLHCMLWIFCLILAVTSVTKMSLAVFGGRLMDFFRF